MKYKNLKSRPRARRVWIVGHGRRVIASCETPMTKYLQRRLKSCWGRSKTPMVNENEPLINLVIQPWRNYSDTPVKRQADSRQDSRVLVFLSVAQPGNRRYLRELVKVNYMEHGKPDKSHIIKGKDRLMRNNLAFQNFTNGIPSVSEGEDLAGRGTKRKLMPFCNGRDRGFYNLICRRDTPS